LSSRRAPGLPRSEARPGSIDAGVLHRHRTVRWLPEARPHFIGRPECRPTALLGEESQDLNGTQPSTRVPLHLLFSSLFSFPLRSFSQPRRDCIPDFPATMTALKSVGGSRERSIPSSPRRTGGRQTRGATSGSEILIQLSVANHDCFREKPRNCVRRVRAGARREPRKSLNRDSTRSGRSLEPCPRFLEIRNVPI
jgi:hypothetical protein